MEKEGANCNCPHHKAVPFLVVLFGLDFLAGAMGWVSESFVAVSWPILVIAAGLTKLSRRMCKCC